MQLDARTLYYMAARDSQRDGKVESGESAVLEKLRVALQLSPDDVRDIFATAEEEGFDADAKPLEAKELFLAACKMAWLDGVLEIAEAEGLTDLAEALELPFEEAEALFEQTRPEGA